jgi:hypothetical protein
MQSVQRHFGKYMRRSADEHNVSVLLKDFDEADHLLAKVGCLSLQPIRCAPTHLLRSLKRPEPGASHGFPS